MLLNLPTVLACTVAAGAVDTTSERANMAGWIFWTAIFVLVAHAALFVYRSLKKQRKSGWIFWVTLALSVFIIPIVIIAVATSAGAACGFGASDTPTFLLVFELTALAAQLVKWRYKNQPTQSPIPQD